MDAIKKGATDAMLGALGLISLVSLKEFLAVVVSVSTIALLWKRLYDSFRKPKTPKKKLEDDVL
jgi:hypothetical protein